MTWITTTSKDMNTLTVLRQITDRSTTENLSRKPSLADSTIDRVATVTLGNSTAQNRTGLRYGSAASVCDTPFGTVNSQ